MVINDGMFASRSCVDKCFVWLTIILIRSPFAYIFMVWNIYLYIYTENRISLPQQITLTITIGLLHKKMTDLFSPINCATILTVLFLCNLFQFSVYTRLINDALYRIPYWAGCRLLKSMCIGQTRCSQWLTLTKT